MHHAVIPIRFCLWHEILISNKRGNNILNVTFNNVIVLVLHILFKYLCMYVCGFFFLNNIMECKFSDRIDIDGVVKLDGQEIPKSKCFNILDQ